MDDLDQGSLVALRTEHLGMIESIISRLSGHSANVKNFSLTLYIGLMALAVSENEPGLLWIAVLVPLLFGVLDGYYLAVERAFVAFYRTVAERPLSQAGNLTMSQAKPKPLMAFFRLAVWPFYVAQSAVAGAVLWKGVS